MMSPISQQRAARRFKVDEPIKVRVLDETETISTGRIRDFSENGLGLHLDEVVPVFADVLIEYRGLFMPGSIAYCHPADSGFRVGVQFEPVPAIQSGLLTLSENLSAAEADALKIRNKRKSVR